MCYAIPIFDNRVAPRYMIAEFIIFLIISGNKTISRRKIKLQDANRIGLAALLYENGADVLVCGGISCENRNAIENSGVMIIDNVCSSFEDVQLALEEGKLYSGFGFTRSTEPGTRPMPPVSTSGSDMNISARMEHMDCLSCVDKICLEGRVCRPGLRKNKNVNNPQTRQILEASLDIMTEKERTLCRLTELIYFCLEMKYKKIGVAFCMELFEQTNILVQLLRRYFDVYPVCCKVGGLSSDESQTASQRSSGGSDFAQIACNPAGQAGIFNELNTDINIIVGLCIGVDCVFSKLSEAPVSTLFVKDKSLAHNPIGALYSDYYLKEITTAKACKS